MPEVTVPGAHGNVAAYFATPSGADPWPAVVVVHEIFGLDDDTRAQTDRLAASGYLAVAPDLFAAGRRLQCLRAAFRELAAGSGRMFDDIAAAGAWLTARRDCTGKVGVIGFCMGGGFALLAAPGGRFDAASVNYGPVPKDAERALAGACPIVGSYGGRDLGLRGHAARLDQALTTLGVEADIKEYPGAGHSFLNHHSGPLFTVMEKVMHAGFHGPSAEDAWPRIFAFFERHLESQREGAAP